MRTRRLDQLAAFVVVTVFAVLFLTGTGTDAAFVVSTGNGGNIFSTVPDWKPPVISRATVIRGSRCMMASLQVKAISPRRLTTKVQRPGPPS